MWLLSEINFPTTVRCKQRATGLKMEIDALLAAKKQKLQWKQFEVNRSDGEIQGKRTVKKKLGKKSKAD